jgi:hypothetical protein
MVQRQAPGRNAVRKVWMLTSKVRSKAWRHRSEEVMWMPVCQNDWMKEARLSRVMQTP